MNPAASPGRPSSKYNYTNRTNGSMDRTSSQGTINDEVTEAVPKTPIDPKSTRTKDPMAFSSILSSTEPDPCTSAPRSMPVSKHLKSSSNDSNGDAKLSELSFRRSTSKFDLAKDYPGQIRRPVKTEVKPSSSTKGLGNTKLKLGLPLDKENEKVKKEMARIDATEASDPEKSEFEVARRRHAKMSQKRQQSIEDVEDLKRKVKELKPP